MVKRRFALSLAILAFLTCAVGCQSRSGEVQTTAPEPALTEPAAPQIALIEQGATAYTLLRPELAESELVQAAVAFRNAFSDAFGTAPGITTDWVRGLANGEYVPADPEACQIILGETNRAETAAVREGMTWVEGYTIQMVGKSLVFLGTDDSMTIKAIEDFTAEYLHSGSALSLPADFTMTYDFARDSDIGSAVVNQFKVVFDDRAAECVGVAASQVCLKLGYPMIAQQPDVEKVIVIGAHPDYPNSVKLADSLDYLDYTISLGENEILIVGGSPLSTQRAAERFLALYAEDAMGKPSEGFTEVYDFSEVRADSLLYHLDKFKPAWADRFTTPAWMLDFEEKSYAILSGKGRFVSDSHRGDHQNYPENSLEAVYSAVLLGADCIEIDIRVTADHIPILMHDATLKRTTDWESKNGKNGLPTSANVEDWTYAQLLALNLKHDGKVTEYKIPTAYEAVAVCANRCFIHWDGKVTLDVNTDIYLLAEELNAKASFYYYYGADVMTKWRSLDRSDAAFDAYYTKMAKYLTLSGTAKAKRDFALVEKYGDNAGGWEKCVADGRRMVFTNKTEDMCRYIAEKKQPQTIPNS